MMNGRGGLRALPGLAALAWDDGVLSWFDRLTMRAAGWASARDEAGDDPDGGGDGEGDDDEAEQPVA